MWPHREEKRDERKLLDKHSSQSPKHYLRMPGSKYKKGSERGDFMEGGGCDGCEGLSAKGGRL